ncbi:hypothetical protein [Pantoea agglomerans]|uniref:hypothetical protein n=1 Tax=Enterobacter agglomerans TaxID=549 RepID=UPI003DA1C62F
MKKAKKLLIYVFVVIMSVLIIPEIILRVSTPRQLARISDFTSLGGILNPLLSLILFLALFSIALAVITILAVKKIYQPGPRS